MHPGSLALYIIVLILCWHNRLLIRLKHRLFFFFKSYYLQKKKIKGGSDNRAYESESLLKLFLISHWRQRSFHTCWVYLPAYSPDQCQGLLLTWDQNIWIKFRPSTWGYSKQAGAWLEFCFPASGALPCSGSLIYGRKDSPQNKQLIFTSSLSWRLSIAASLTSFCRHFQQYSKRENKRPWHCSSHQTFLVSGGKAPLVFGRWKVQPFPDLDAQGIQQSLIWIAVITS